MLNFGKNLSAAIACPRLHHQLCPNHVQIENNFKREYQEGLEERGHMVKKDSVMAVVQGIVRSGRYINATSDNRKGGKPDGF